MNLDINSLISYIDECNNDKKKLLNSLFSIVMLLQYRTNFKSEKNNFPLPATDDFIHYILLKNKYIADFFYKNKVFKLFESSSSELVLKRRVKSNGKSYLTSELDKHLSEDNRSIKYDIAISFAGENRKVARKIAKTLKSEYNLKVFYDEFEELRLWGNDLFNFLYTVYYEESRLCIILFSSEYKTKIWTQHEFRAVSSRMLKENYKYILPLKLDKIALPKELENLSYINYTENHFIEMCEEINSRVWSMLKKTWFTFSDDQEFADFFTLDKVLSVFSSEFIKEFEKEEDEIELLVKMILSLIFLHQEDVKDEIKGFFEFLVFGLDVLAERFISDEYSIISDNGLVKRLKVGNQILAIQKSYWEPILQQYNK